MRFQVEPSQNEVAIYEDHNTPNRIVIKRGELSINQAKAIAYQLLAMTGETGE